MTFALWVENMLKSHEITSLNQFQCVCHLKIGFHHVSAIVLPRFTSLTHGEARPEKLVVVGGGYIVWNAQLGCWETTTCNGDFSWGLTGYNGEQWGYNLGILRGFTIMV